MERDRGTGRRADRAGPPVSDTRRRGGVGVCWAGCVGPRGRFLAVQRGLRGRPKGQLGQVVCRPLMAFGFCFAAGLGLTGFGLRSGSRVRARLGLRASVRVRAGVG